MKNSFQRICFTRISLHTVKFYEYMVGTCHFDEIGYLFRMSLYDKLSMQHLKKGSQDYRIMQQLTELWTNFAKYG